MTHSSNIQMAPAETFLPGPILLLGAPGVGKGTQAQILMAQFSIPQISTGEILRRNITNGTALGIQAKDLMEQGLFVDDQTVNGMVASRIQEPDVESGFILDGYPRTLAQATFIDSLLSSHAEGEKNTPGLRLPLVAISIRVETEELLRRITGRRICPACKRSYNIYSQPPRQPGRCDFDQEQLEQRVDDTEETFRERMLEYALKTTQVIDHYRATGSFEEIDGARSVEDVAFSVGKSLARLRARKVSVA